MKLTALVPFLLLAACSKGSTTSTEAPHSPDKPAETPADKVTSMNAAIDALMAKPEHKDQIGRAHV